MTIDDLTPQEKRLLFMMRLCDALADPSYRKVTLRAKNPEITADRNSGKPTVRQEEVSDT